MEILEDISHIQVRFSEIDSMKRVWHGSYLKYFEDGREAFGRRYPGIGYSDMETAGIYAPLYDFHIRYYAPLAINDIAVIYTRYVYKRGARIDLNYKIYRESDNVLCAEGDSIQLFIDSSGNLLSFLPDFYAEWQEKYIRKGVNGDQL